MARWRRRSIRDCAILARLPQYFEFLGSNSRKFEKRKGVEPGAECRPVCPLVVWSVKNGAFRIWGCKTKLISYHTAVVRDRVRDDHVFDDVGTVCCQQVKCAERRHVFGETCGRRYALCHAVLQQNVPEVGACSVGPASVP